MAERPIGVEDNSVPACPKCWGCTHTLELLNLTVGGATPALLPAAFPLLCTPASASQQCQLLTFPPPTVCLGDRAPSAAQATWHGQDRNIKMHPGNTGASIFLATRYDGIEARDRGLRH